MSVLVVVVLAASALMLASCGSASSNDAKLIQGTWKVENTTQQMVITATEIKTIGNTFKYELPSAGKITITYNSQSINATYTLSKDGKTLTIVQTIPADATTSTAQPQTSKLVLIKVSDSISTEPTVTAS
ncbi:MAG: hypothetical protein FWF45_06420 [Coriobacteriia bacterium]|nr:hypothetical protein [Coriobacteriia bacterium]